MKRSATVLFALLFAGAAAVAAEPPSRGFYLGGNVGVATLDDDGMFAGLQFDDSGTSYGVYGGYKILKYLAVEARFSNQGSYSIGGGGLQDDLDATAYSAHIVGIVPFGTSGWELFGELGIGNVKLDSECCGSDDSSAASAGIGVRYYPTPHLGIAIQTDAYAWEESVNGTRDVGIAATQLAVHYLF
jgi:OOP family OmpA-OmpF porin